MRHALPFLALLGCKPAPPATPSPASPVTLRVVAMNDFHGAIYESPERQDPSRALGGLPVLAGAVEALRAEDPDLVLLDGGDLFQGSWPVNASKGMGSVEALNLLRVDAAAIGNHEFDYGGIDGGHARRGALEAGARRARFEWLSANVTHEDGAPWRPDGVAPWTILERKGVKIGVIGLTTQDTPQTTLQKNVADLRFGDVVEAVRATLPELESRGAQVIAVVGHLTGSCAPKAYAEAGEPCLPGGEIGQLLTELPPGTIDLLVLGHAHTLMAHRWGDTFLLENRAQGHMLGQVDLVVGPDGVDADASVLHAPWLLTHAAVDPGCEDRPYPLEPLDVGGRTITPSAEAVALMERLEASAGSLCDEVGCSQAPLGRDRQRESGVGDFVADAMLAAYPGADLAVQNSGGLRDDLPAGPIRRQHLQAVMPFENQLLLVSITGRQLSRLLQVGSSGAHGILQIAGGSYHFDPSATGGEDQNGDGTLEAWETDRLCSATVGDAPIDPDRTYQIVTTDFLYGGGDHLGPAFADASVVAQGPLLRDALITYVEGLGSCLGATHPLPDPGAPRVRMGPC